VIKARTFCRDNPRHVSPNLDDIQVGKKHENAKDKPSSKKERPARERQQKRKSLVKIVKSPVFLGNYSWGFSGMGKRAIKAGWGGGVLEWSQKKEGAWREKRGGVAV